MPTPDGISTLPWVSATSMHLSSRHVPARVLVLGLVLLLGLAYCSVVDKVALPRYVPSAETRALGHPTFAEVREAERLLPQHRAPGRWALGGKGKRGRYVYFPWEAWGTGWNNVFQEQLLNTHLAFRADRGYVFGDYIARDHPPFSDTLPNGTRSHLHIPMGAFTSGPTGGGAWGGREKGRPRGISRAWWDVVCKGRKTVLSAPEMNRELAIGPETSGADRMVRWGAKLKDMEAECVEVVDGTPFDYPFIITDKPASIWDWPASYGASLTLTAFRWSALVTRALIRNHALFAPSLPTHLRPSLPWHWHLRLLGPPDLGSTAAPLPLSAVPPLTITAPPLTGLLALHVRRGDYQEHCPNLVAAAVPYNTWNALPALPDRRSPHSEMHAHCFPGVTQILAKIESVLKTERKFKVERVYIATNGDADFISQLTERLKTTFAVPVASSRDMRLTPEEEAVGQAVDMAVLTAAEVFIGNGWSSLTSNVVQLRLAGGRPAARCRFW